MRNIIHIKLFLVNKKTWDYYSKSYNFRKDVFKKKMLLKICTHVCTDLCRVMFICVAEHLL